MAQELDVVRLKSAMLDATRATYDALKQQHGNEKLYAFGLCPSNEGTGVWPTANTEEGLLRTALSYHNRRGGGVERQAISLRWSDGDFAYSLAGEEFFSEAQRIITGFAWIVADGAYRLNESVDAERLYELCCEVLQALDAESVFGRGEERERLIILLSEHDCDYDATLRWAQRLNSDEACARLASELTQSHETSRVLFKERQELRNDTHDAYVPVR